MQLGVKRLCHSLLKSWKHKPQLVWGQNLELSVDWVKRKQLKIDEGWLWQAGGQVASGAVKDLPTNFSSLLKEWENCPFQGHLRLLTPRSGIDSSSSYNDQNVQRKYWWKTWKSFSMRGNFSGKKSAQRLWDDYDLRNCKWQGSVNEHIRPPHLKGWMQAVSKWI